jgi:hypothetical protein
VSVRLFSRDELAAAFRLVVPSEVAEECASEWFVRFPEENEVDSAGFYVVDPSDTESSADDEEPQILAISEAPDSAASHDGLVNMSLDVRRRWLLSFTDFHLGLVALTSKDAAHRVQSYLGETDDQMRRRLDGMRRVVQALGRGTESP